MDQPTQGHATIRYTAAQIRDMVTHLEGCEQCCGDDAEIRASLHDEGLPPAELEEYIRVTQWVTRIAANQQPGGCPGQIRRPSPPPAKAGRRVSLRRRPTSGHDPERTRACTPGSARSPAPAPPR
ncbi:hypothetical protein [Sphaerisporangium rhizosphaerae]|uniref:Mycothiol system anti-sigma-R factor n=1 Tax=Sphaerisporangium rhizosphaerae TaxID=2269375 RepID=A0ABW2PG04_9ACTN